MSKSPAATKFLRIGQLAARSGVSAKALRLYEARGLLAPDAHSGSGYRLYGATALARLNEIRVLKRAGFTLAEIGRLLQREGSATALIEARIVALRNEVRSKAQALGALERAWYGLDSAANDIGVLLESIKMNDRLDVQLNAADKAAFQSRSEILGRHFTAEERASLRRRAERFGADNMQRYNQQWRQLIAEVRGAMAAGKPPLAPAVLELGRRWHALILAFSGGDANLGLKMRAAYAAEPQVMRAQGMSEVMFGYIGKAMRAAGLSLAG